MALKIMKSVAAPIAAAVEIVAMVVVFAVVVLAPVTEAVQVDQ